MLTAVAEGPAVVACNTCRHPAAGRTDGEGLTGGARLVAALRAAQAADRRYAGVSVQEMPCLFACADPCTVHIRAPGRIGCVLGRFTPDADSAKAILDYAARHAASEAGEVPFRDWPEDVKGHFIVRVPPSGYVAE